MTDRGCRRGGGRGRYRRRSSDRNTGNCHIGCNGCQECRGGAWDAAWDGAWEGPWDSAAAAAWDTAQEEAAATGRWPGGDNVLEEGEKRCGKAGWLYVRNLPSGFGAAALRDMFGNFGRVKNVNIMSARSADRGACAFVKYHFGCEAALAVRKLHQRYEVQEGLGPVTVQVNVPGMFLDNLPADVEEEMLFYVFSFYGEVKTIHITAGQPRSGRARAFVEYSSVAEVATATSAFHELRSADHDNRRSGSDSDSDDLDNAVEGALPRWLRIPPPTGPRSAGDGIDANGHGTEGACVICMAAPKTHAFVPCGHRCACAGCSDVVLGQLPAACPVCRAAAERAIHIFC